MGFTKLLVLLVIVALSAAQSTSNSSTVHVDDYITANRRHYEEVIKDYDYQLQSFEDLYNGRISTIDIHLDLLVDLINEANERLTTLEILSSYAKECVNKYNSLPTEANITAVIQGCSQTANNQTNSLISAPTATRNNMEYYYNTTFEMELSKCGNNSNISQEVNYTLCVTTVISNANTYTIDNRKTFNNQMDIAKCSANANIKTALDCSFTTQSNTLTVIYGTEVQIDQCIQGTDCTTCTGYYCQNVERVNSTSINPQNQTMPNPLYGRNETLSCLMLDIV